MRGGLVSIIARMFSRFLDRAVSTASRRMQVACPGKVTAFDASTQTATVQPMLREIDDAYEEQEDFIYRDPALVYHVPVIWPIAREFALSGLTLEAGDPVLLVATDHSFGDWWDSGALSNPDDDRRHLFGAGVVAIAGFLPKTNPVPVPGDAAALASKANARLDDIEAYLATLRARILDHVHVSASPGSATSTASATAPPTVIANAPSGDDVSSSVVKISS